MHVARTIAYVTAELASLREIAEDAPGRNEAIARDEKELARLVGGASPLVLLNAGDGKDEQIAQLTAQVDSHEATIKAQRVEISDLRDQLAPRGGPGQFRQPLGADPMIAALGQIGAASPAAAPVAAPKAIKRKVAKRRKSK